MKRTLLAFATLLMAMAVNAQAWEELSKHNILPYEPEDNAYEKYGGAVAIDGNYAIIGVPGYDGNKGCADVIHYNGTSWETLIRLTASDGELNDNFGNSVAISGTTVIVGAYDDDNSGSAYIFDGANAWAETKLTASDGAYMDRFGQSVAISGTTAVVGAIWDDDMGAQSGSAYIFDGANDWAETKLTASDGEEFDLFGCSVAICGTTVIVGAYLDDDVAEDSGSAYIFDGANAWQETKLTASDAADYNYFGYSVGISGNTAIVGAYEDNNMGAAYIFDGTNTWAETKLTASDGEVNDNFGYSVAINGSTAIVGNNADFKNGSAYIFDGENAWEETKIIASDGFKFDAFGYSVAISGTTAIVGAAEDDDLGLDSGSAYIFDGSSGWTANMSETQKLFSLAPPSPSNNLLNGYYAESVAVSENYAIVGVNGYKSQQGCAYILYYNGTDWQTIARLTASDGTWGDRFGHSVAINGTTAVVGADSNGKMGSGNGSAYVFSYDGTSWTQAAKLTASDGIENDGFGCSVGISGTTVIVGAYADDDMGEGSGSVYIFDGANALTETKLTASDGKIANYFGFSVAISNNTAIVGATHGEGASPSCGSAYIFRNDGSAWTQTAKLIASDGDSFDSFGWSVDICDKTAIVGAYNDDDMGYGSGGAYIFTNNGSNWTQTTKLLASDGESFDYFGWSVSISGTTAIVGASFDDDKGNESGSAYIFDGANAWSETKLTASDGQVIEAFGYSVSISGSMAIVGAPSDDDKGKHSGSAYFFKAPTFDKWTGAANNTLWTDIYNWDGGILPNGNYPVQIPTGCTYYPELTTDLSYANTIYIKPSASLTVNAGQSLDLGTSGISNEAGGAGLLLKADATGRGQVLLPADHKEVAATVQHYFVQDKWKSFGFGVHNFSKNDVSPADIKNWYVLEFVEGRAITGDNTNHKENWGYLQSDANNTDAINGLQGYMGYANAAAQTVSTTGDLCSNDVTYTLTYTPESGTGWNLLANPYPTKLDLDNGWNFGGSIGSARYVHRNGQYHAAISKTDGDFDVIEPGEAFFVKAENSNDLSFLLSASAARVLEGSSADKKSEDERLNVSIANTTNSDHFTVTLNSEATEGFDLRYDAYKMFGDADRPYIYQKADNKKLSINSIANFDEETTLPFAVVIPSAGKYSLSFSTSELNGQKLWVRNLTTTVEQAVGNITLTASEAGEQAFELFVKKKLSATDPLKKGSSIFSNGEYLFVEIGGTDNALLGIYNLQGQLVRSETLTSSYNKIELPAGAYIIKLNTKSETKTERIAIR